MGRIKKINALLLLFWVNSLTLKPKQYTVLKPINTK